MLRIKLYDLIESRGFTQKRLYEETGVREATISDMCNNNCKMLRVESLSKICAILNCKIEDILEFIPDKKSL